MKLIKNGKITLKEAAEILDRSVSSINALQKEFGIETVIMKPGRDRAAAAEANKLRNELLETLAKRVKYDNEDVHALAAEHKIPSRTLYRWVHRV